MATTTACAGGGTSADKDTLASDPLERIKPEQLYVQGERLARQGDPIRAEQYLSSAIQRGYSQQRALPLLLRVCVMSSRLGAALQYATPYLRLHPDDYHLRYLVAAVQLGLQRPNEARSELERVLLQAPDYAEAHYLLGIVLRDHLGDSAAAADEFALHQKYSPSGLHGAEVAAWLREHAKHSASASAPSPADSVPTSAVEPQVPTAAPTDSVKVPRTADAPVRTP